MTEIRIFPEQPSADELEPHPSDRIYVCIVDRFVQYDMRSIIVACAWSCDRRWNTDLMMRRPTLHAINGVPC